MSLEEFGTVAFDRDLMHRLIGVGEIVQDDDGMVRLDTSRTSRGVIQFGLWLTFVPEAYREIARLASAEAFSRYSGRIATPRTVSSLIEEIRQVCVREVRHAKETAPMVQFGVKVRSTP